MLACAVDFTAIVHRAFHAGGNPTKLTMAWVLAVLLELEPDFCVLAIDHPGQTFRHRLFPGYKSVRAKKPGRAEEQAKIRDHQTTTRDELARVYGLHALSVPGFEADDIIGTFVHQAVKANVSEVVVVANDKDLLQLVGGTVSMRQFPGAETRSTEEVFEKFGVYPEQFVDYLALVGDHTDSIPGVRGIGPEGAVALLRECGSIEGILDTDPKILAGPGKRVHAAGAEYCAAMRRLVTVSKDVPLELSDFAVNKGRLREGIGWSE